MRAGETRNLDPLELSVLLVTVTCDNDGRIEVALDAALDRIEALTQAA